MRVLVFSLLTVFGSMTLVAEPSQSFRVGELKQQLIQARHDSTRLKFCVLIAQHYFTRNQYDSVYTYTQYGLQLVKTGPSGSYAGDLYYFLAMYYRHRGLYRKGIPPIQQAIRYAQQARNVKKTVEYQYTLAMIYSDASDLSSAVDQIGANLTYLRDNEDGPALASNYLLMIELFRGLNNPAMEDLYTRSYFALDKRSWPPVDRMYAYILRGEVLEKKGRLREAQHQYYKALHCARLTNSPLRVIEGLAIIGINLRNQQQYQAAIQLFNQAFDRARNVSNISFMAGLKRELSTTYLACQQPKEALLYARNALKLSRQNKQKDGLIASLKSLVAALEANGLYRQALSMYQEQQQLKEQKYTETNVQKIAQMQAQFEAETKEKTIKILQTNAQISQLNALRQREQITLAQRTQFAAVTIIGLLLMLIGAVYYFLRKSERNYTVLTHQQELLQQTARELAETNATKDKLFSLISHDLRSPIASMKLNVRQIQESDKQPRLLLPLMARLEQQVDTVLALLTNLLDWSMVQMKGFQVLLQPIRLHDITEETISQAGELIRQKQLILVNQVEKSSLVMADKHQLRAVVRNLFGNAIKFTPPGGYIRVVSVSQGEFAELQIRDSGLGMSAGQLNALFSSPEVRTGTMGESGVGLGLRICQEMLDRQGGTLHIESRPNGGTLVRVRLAVPAEHGQSALG